MIRQRRALSLVCVLWLSTLSLAARAADAPEAEKPFLHPLFQNDMVLQRDAADPVWGWTEPGKQVTVSVAGKTATATAGADGKWVARVGPLTAGGPFELTVSGPHDVKLTGVLVGDVWVCSGQSNMEMGVAGVTNGPREIEEADHPRLRLFTVPKHIAYTPQTGFAEKPGQATWLICTPKGITAGDWGGFSAVGYFFGRDLERELKIPIGLVHTSWGGTVAEAWTSEEALKPLNDFNAGIDSVHGQASNTSSESTEVQMTKFIARVDPGSATTGGWAETKLADADWKPITLPGAWKRAGVGLEHHDGVVWFRKSVELSPEWIGEDLKLDVGPTTERCAVWVNGTALGETEKTSPAKQYKIPAALTKDATLQITLRVFAAGGEGGLGGTPDQTRLVGPGQQPMPLGGTWKFKPGADLAKVGRPPQARQNNPNQPTVLYNGMVNPLVPFAIKGAIWYQGESNADRAKQYRALLPAMIRDWRGRFTTTGSSEKGFPFLIVQLAAFMDEAAQPSESQWAELREAQDFTARTVGASAIAVATDIGEAKDIHPHNKQEVGRRLALDALALAYGKDVEYSGPAYKSMDVKDDKVTLHFDHLGGGLDAKGGTLKGFAVAGEDKKFTWADAKIEGDTVVVSSPDVPHPTAVRYAWENNPAKANLFNKAGLPAPPFRTDGPR